jgi:hypothetical protein
MLLCLIFGEIRFDRYVFINWLSYHSLRIAFFGNGHFLLRSLMCLDIFNKNLPIAFVNVEQYCISTFAPSILLRGFVPFLKIRTCNFWKAEGKSLLVMSWRGCLM